MMPRHIRIAAALASVSIISLELGATPAYAQATEEKRSYNIEAQALGDALSTYAEQTGIEIIFTPDAVRGKRSNALRGSYTPTEALMLLLRGTGLSSRRGSGTTMIIGFDLREGAVGAASADSGGVADPVEEQAIVVTGSRIAGAAAAGSHLTVLNRNTILQRGFGSAPEIVRSLPQVSQLGASDITPGLSGGSSHQNSGRNLTGGVGVNLRGLGPDATLVLLDGRRMAPSGAGTYADVSTIPAGLIERVEILADGASAIYGSDAVAGVVNFVLRRELDGLEISARGEMADGYDKHQIAGLAGPTWTGGSAVFAYQYENRSNLSADDRSHVRMDQRFQGGRDYRDNAGGTLIAGGSTYAIPRDQSGRALRPDQLVEGTQNYSDRLAGVDILPASETHTFFSYGNQQLTSDLRLIAEGRYTTRQLEANSARVSLAVPVSRTNPFFVSPDPEAQIVIVGYEFGAELGNARYRNHFEAWSATAGVEADLGREWTATLEATLSQDSAALRQSQVVNFATLFRSLASADPATAFNPFGDGSANSASIIRAISGYAKIDEQSDLDVQVLRLSGPILQMPAGAVKVAIGAQRQSERFQRRSELFLSSFTPTVTSNRIRREVRSVYGELAVPVFGEDNDLPLLRRLSVSAAYRLEDYEGFGYTGNPKIGVTWIPLQGVALRGSWGTSFKAPLLFQVAPTGLSLDLFDLPGPDGGLVSTVFLQGPNSSLKPETAESVTLGIDLNPYAIPGLQVGLTYFNTDFENKVAMPTVSLATALTQVGLEPFRVFKPSKMLLSTYYDDPTIQGAGPIPPGVEAFFDGRLHNIGGLKVQGLDFAASYQRALADLEVGVGLAGTFLDTYEQTATPGGVSADLVNTLYYPPKLRFRLDLSASRGAASVNVALNHVNSYRNETVTPTQRIGAWTTIDASASYVFGKGNHPLRVGLTVTNLMNKKPPFVDVAGGYDPNNASVLGRLVALQLTKAW